MSTPPEGSGTRGSGGLLEIDGSRYSGSGTLVRQSVAYAALTGRAIRMVHARAHRPKAGLRHQHLAAVEAVRDLTAGTLDGAALSAREFVFRPGHGSPARSFRFDVGSAGSATVLALAILPVLASRPERCEVELIGGLFQDFAPSVFHLEHVLLPLVARMGLHAQVRLVRPGYVPRGGGILRLTVEPVVHALQPLRLEQAGPVGRVWGIALSSHLADRHVSSRMAAAARAVLQAAGHEPTIDEQQDTSAMQPGAALALFADLPGGARLGADRPGAPRRSAESIGARVAHQLVAEIETEATVDRFTADQILPFAALADGETRVRIPQITEHIKAGAWLAELFLGSTVRLDGTLLTVHGRPVMRASE